MNLSFAGCGFMGFYHLGVAACIRSYLPDLCFKRISGASAGAIAAVCLLCDAPLGEITGLILNIATKARNRLTGPFSPCLDIQTMLKEGLERYLPDDVHVQVSGRVNISVTCVYTQRNEVLTHFRSKDELIQALMCSSFIPGFSGLIPPKFRGARYMDGGFTKNLLLLDENTVTVSPFCGLSHICPRDSLDTFDKIRHIVIADTSIELSLANLNRIIHIMFPPNTEALSQICKQGFSDAKLFLQRNNLIGCHPCVSSRWLGNAPLSQLDKCVNCELQRKMALEDDLPDTVFSILQNAIEATNKEFTSWIFKNRVFKLVTFFSAPYIFPAEVVVAVAIKVLRGKRTKGDSSAITESAHPKGKTLPGEIISNEMSLGLELDFHMEPNFVNYESFCTDSLEETIAYYEDYERQVISSYA